MLKKGVGLARSKGRPLEKGLCIHFPCGWGSVHTRCSMPLGSFAHPSNHLFNNIYSNNTYYMPGTVQDSGVQQ